MGLFRTPSKTGAHRCVPLALPPHLKSQMTSLSLTAACVFTTYQFSNDKYPKWAYLDNRAACHLGTCVS